MIKQTEKCKTCFTLEGDFGELNKEIISLKRRGHIHFETKWKAKGLWQAVISTKIYPNNTHKGNVV